MSSPRITLIGDKFLDVCNRGRTLPNQNAFNANELPSAAPRLKHNSLVVNFRIEFVSRGQAKSSPGILGNHNPAKTVQPEFHTIYYAMRPLAMALSFCQQIVRVSFNLQPQQPTAVGLNYGES